MFFNGDVIKQWTTSFYFDNIDQVMFSGSGVYVREIAVYNEVKYTQSFVIKKGSRFNALINEASTIQMQKQKRI